MNQKTNRTTARLTELWRKMTGRVNLDEFCPTVSYDEAEEAARA